MSEIGINDIEVGQAKPSIEMSASRGFPSWLATNQVSLAFTTYQAGKLFLLGIQPDNRLSGFERTFNRCMGLWSDGQSLWMSSLYQIWRMENTLLPGQSTHDGYDRVYVPQVGYTTGDIDVHDIDVDNDGRPVFVTALFGALATVSERFSFRKIWRPPFLSKMAAEDRCHLNGVALRDGKPRYVTACSQTDIVDGWRNHRVGGGCVMDVDANEVVTTGLSMPHSPRWHGDKLWLLDSGTGYLGFIDAEGKFQRVCFCPGFARGMVFCGDYVIVGVSKCRAERTFSGLPLDENLSKHGGVAQCGLCVIDLNRGDIVQWFRLEGVVEELYDVALLPKVVRPKAIGFKTEEIRHIVNVQSDDEITRWTANS